MNERRLFSRRQFIVGSGAALGGLFLPGCSKGPLPPTYGNILRVADNFTYVAHRTLLPGQKLAREYSRSDICSFPAIGTTDPGSLKIEGASGLYRQLQTGAFADWRLSIEGSVERPGNYSLAELKAFPSRTQITRQTCEEGWSAIAEWTGVQLSRVLFACGMLPSARCVCVHAYDDWVDSIDLLDALHPQTMLAYGMNGNDLSVPHGAPVRLRVETQLGYKCVKFLQRIVVRDKMDDGGDKGNPKNGWAWYAGI